MNSGRGPEAITFERPSRDSLLKSSTLIPTAAIGVIYLTHLVGTYHLGWVDLRLSGIIASIFAALILAPLRPLGGATIPAYTLFPMLFLSWVGWLMFSSAWSPPGARTVPALADLGSLMVLFGASQFVITRTPQRVLRRVWLMVWVAGLAFAMIALAMGTVTESQGRLTAPGGGPNVFVRIVGLGVVAGIALSALNGDKVRGRWLLPLPVLGMAAILSGSRGGVLAILITLVYICALTMRSRSRRVRLSALGAASVSVVTFMIFVWPRVEAYVRDRYVEATLIEGYTSGRDRITRQALELFCEEPLIGQGLDGFWALTGGVYTHAHNLILASATEGGVVGALLVVGALISGLVAAWVPVREGAHLEAHLFIGAALLVLVSAMFSGTWYDSRFIWFFLLIAAEVKRRSNAGAERC